MLLKSPRQSAAAIIAIGLFVVLYLLWLGGDRFYAAVAGLGLVAIGLNALVIWLALLVVSYVLLWLLPRGARKFCRRHRVRYRVVLLTCGVFFLYTGWVLNHRWLPHRFDVVSLAADLVVTAFALLMAWALMRPSTKRLAALGFGTVAFAAFVVVVSTAGMNPGASLRKPSESALAALPYVTWTPAGDGARESGVTLYDEERAFAGVNFFSSWNLPAAWLVDMSGNVVHEWSSRMQDGDRWPYVELAGDGGVLAIVNDETLLRVDRDSNIDWLETLRCHHDIALSKNGDVYVLGRKDAVVRFGVVPMPLLDDHIVVLSPEHHVKKRISLYDVLHDQLPRTTPLRVYRWFFDPRTLRQIVRMHREHGCWFGTGKPVDAFHANTLELVDRDLNDVVRPGRILFCARELDLIGIIDEKTERLVWWWGPGVLERPHNPTLLENGNILVFDNGVRRRYSRIVELDPLTKNIVWQYKAEPPTEFFSHRRGGNQRLPNGNTLVTSSDSGRVFEVTKDGRIVWEFYNPVTRKAPSDDRVLRATIYRMTRITDADARGWLEEAN